jgi:hypothetical protein
VQELLRVYETVDSAKLLGKLAGKGMEEEARDQILDRAVRLFVADIVTAVEKWALMNKRKTCIGFKAEDNPYQLWLALIP